VTVVVSSLGVTSIGVLKLFRSIQEYDV